MFFLLLWHECLWLIQVLFKTDKHSMMMLQLAQSSCSVNGQADSLFHSQLSMKQAV